MTNKYQRGRELAEKLREVMKNENVGECYQASIDILATLIATAEINADRKEFFDQVVGVLWAAVRTKEGLLLQREPKE